MSIKHYYRVLIVRFLAYLAVFIGFLSIAFQFGPVILAETNYRKDKLLGLKHQISPTIITSNTLNASNSASMGQNPTKNEGFGALLGLGSSLITPVSTDYGIVIEKINANAKIIADVNPADQREYTKALKQGVAEAKGSTKPGEPGNLYIFSHSADAPWNIIRYNAIFYLLRELEKGDYISIFYKGKRFDYIVFDKTITEPTDVSFLNNQYDKPVLTLQTCDPPGTLNNRLIVRAQLAGG